MHEMSFSFISVPPSLIRVAGAKSHLDLERHLGKRNILLVYQQVTIEVEKMVEELRYELQCNTMGKLTLNDFPSTTNQ